MTAHTGGTASLSVLTVAVGAELEGPDPLATLDVEALLLGVVHCPRLADVHCFGVPGHEVAYSHWFCPKGHGFDWIFFHWVLFDWVLDWIWVCFDWWRHDWRRSWWRIDWLWHWYFLL